jgi:hypothetical protein
MNPYYEHFKLVHGGGLDKDEGKEGVGGVYRSVLYQRGYGLGQYYDYSDRHGLGFMDGLMSVARFVLPSMKSGLKYLGNQAVETVANIAQDAIAGKDIKESAKERVRSTAQEIFAKVPAALADTLSGDKRTGVKRRAVSRTSAGRLVASARKPAKRAKKRHHSVDPGLLAQYPALDKLV